MALNIKSAEVDRLARELAALTGESITEVVTKELERRLEELWAERDVRRRERLRASLDAIRARVEVSRARSPDRRRDPGLQRHRHLRLMVVASSAFVAFLLDEPEAPAIRDALITPLAVPISAVTLFETRTVLRGRFGPGMLQGLDDLPADLRPEVKAFDGEQSRLAFAAYRRYGKGSGHPARLNLGACAAYALATSLDMPLLFKGDDFRRTDVRPALG